MSLIIDIILILAAIAAIFFGIMRGFVKSVMGFASMIIAVALSYFFSAPAAAWLNENYIGQYVDSIVSDSITGIVTAGEQQLGLAKIIEDRPEALDTLATRFGYNLDEISEYYTSALSGSADSEALAKLSSYIATPTADTISSVLGAILVFFAAVIVLKLITYILNLIVQLPLLKTINTLLGFLFGILNAAVSVWVISNMAVGLIRALGAIDDNLFNQSVIDSTKILRFLCENNLLLFK